MLVSSFHLPTVDRVRALDGGLATAFLHIRIDGPTALAKAVEHGHGALHPWDPCVTADLVTRAHDLGVQVNTWTVDDPDRMVELAGWGIDGIVTNVPDLARETLGSALAAGDYRPRRPPSAPPTPPWAPTCAGRPGSSGRGRSRSAAR